MSENIIYEEKINNLTIKIYPDENYWEDDPNDWNPDIQLVHYHRDFWVTSNVISEDEIRAWYLGEKNEKLQEIEKRWHIFAVSALIHGGIWLKLGYTGFMGDPGGWDTSHVGAILVSKKIAKKYEKAKELAEDTIKTWNDLLTGNVYGYVIEGPSIDLLKNETISCWGFIGDYDSPGGCLDVAREEAKRLAEEARKYKSAEEFVRKQWEFQSKVFSKHPELFRQLPQQVQDAFTVERIAGVGKGELAEFLSKYHPQYYGLHLNKVYESFRDQFIKDIMSSGFKPRNIEKYVDYHNDKIKFMMYDEVDKIANKILVDFYNLATKGN